MQMHMSWSAKIYRISWEMLPFSIVIWIRLFSITLGSLRDIQLMVSSIHFISSHVSAHHGMLMRLQSGGITMTSKNILKAESTKHETCSFKRRELKQSSLIQNGDIHEQISHPLDFCLCNTTADTSKRMTTTPTTTIVAMFNRAGPFFFLLCCNNAAGFMRPISPDRRSRTP